MRATGCPERQPALAPRGSTPRSLIVETASGGGGAEKAFAEGQWILQLLAQLPMAPEQQVSAAGGHSLPGTSIHRLLRSLPNSLLRQLLPRAGASAHRPSLGRLDAMPSKPVACTCHSPAAWKSWEERVVSVWFRACADAAAIKPSLKSSRHLRDVDCRAAALYSPEPTEQFQPCPSCHARSATHGTPGKPIPPPSKRQEEDHRSGE